MKRWNAKRKPKHTTKLKWKDVRSEHWIIYRNNGNQAKTLPVFLRSKRRSICVAKGRKYKKSRY